MRALRLTVTIASGLLACAVLFGTTALAQPQPAPNPTVFPSISADPDQPGATPHWTITIGAEYCGGYRVGDGVYLRPEPPLALPASLTDASVLFAGQPSSTDRTNGVLRVAPAPGLVQSMICLQGQRPLQIELLPEAGFALPDAPGDYALDVWTGADATPISLVLTVPADSDGQSDTSAAD